MSTYTRTTSDLYDRLCSLRRPRVINDDVKVVLGAAFESGGYVAGGLACRALASIDRGIFSCHMKDLTDGDELDDVYNAAIDVGTYLDVWNSVPTHDVYSGEKVTYDGMQMKSKKGDIDVFFGSENSKSEFLSRLTVVAEQASKTISVNPSPSGKCLDIMCGNTTLVQVIMHHIFDIQEQLERFDISNARVAFNDKELIVCDEWQSLMASRTLHVGTWSSPMVLFRISKWMRKHKLIKVSEQTAKELPLYTLETIKALRDSPVNDVLFKGYRKTSLEESRFKTHLAELLPHVSEMDLVLLSTLWPMQQVAYGEFSKTPLGELFKRRGIMTENTVA